jgi:hypothetical protein
LNLRYNMSSMIWNILLPFVRGLFAEKFIKFGTFCSSVCVWDIHIISERKVFQRVYYSPFGTLTWQLLGVFDQSMSEGVKGEGVTSPF